MFIFPVRVKYVLLIIGLLQIVYPLSRGVSPLLVGGHLGGLVAAGLMLLLTGGEPSCLDRPIKRIAEALGRLRPAGGNSGAGNSECSENLEVKIDAILDRISRGGMKSFTNAEKQFLRDASERMNKTKH